MRRLFGLLLVAALVALAPASPRAQSILLSGNIPGTETTVSLGTTERTSLANIDVDATTIIGHVDGLEGLVDGVETSLTTIIGHVDGIEAALSPLLTTSAFTTVFGSASILTTTQADNLALTLDSLNVSAFLYMYDGTNLDLVRGDATNGLLANTELTSGDLDTGAGTVTRAEVGLIFAASGGPTQVSAAAGLPVNCIVGCSSAGGSSIADRTGTFTPGTTSFTLAGGFVDDTATDTLSEGQPGAARITTQRGLHVNPRDAAGAQLLGTATAAGDAMSNPTLGGLLNYNLVWNTGSSQWQRLQASLSSEVTQDTPFTWSGLVGGVGMLRASTAAPAVVTTDRPVAPWGNTAGAQAAFLVGGSNAIIGGDAPNGLDVDVTRLPALAAGTNNIGDVDVLTLPALPAGTNNIGDVDVLTMPATGTTGSAVPAAAMYLGGRDGANLRPFTNCGTNAHLRMTTATTTELVAAPGSGRVRFCTLQVFAEGTTNVTIVRGTGTNCGTGTATIAGPFGLTAQTGWNLPVGIGEVMDAGADTAAVCITSSAAVGVTVWARQTSY